MSQPVCSARQIVALIPAHNEGLEIARTIAAIRAQTVPVTRLVVISDNSTDDTVERATEAGVEVMVSVNNHHRKAGALNQALARILPTLQDTDYVLIQDADTRLNPEFLAGALEAFDEFRNVGGVCARYDVTKPRNLLEQLQANEFARARRQATRKDSVTRILVGIASLFPVHVLRHVMNARKKGQLPGTRESTVYTPLLAEDYELTLALKTLRYTLVCPPGCRPATDAMDTITKLWHQRLRWNRGGLEGLDVYGISRVTRYYVLAMIGRLLAMLSLFVLVGYFVSLQFVYGSIEWATPWLSITALFIADRLVTVRKEGGKAIVTAALILPEMAYDWFNSISFLVALAKHIRNTETRWVDT